VVPAAPAVPVDSPDRGVLEAPVVPAPRVRLPVGTALLAGALLVLALAPAVLARVPAAPAGALVAPAWDPVAPVVRVWAPAARASPAA
jgi:hypothetical protein